MTSKYMRHGRTVCSSGEEGASSSSPDMWSTMRCWYAIKFVMRVADARLLFCGGCPAFAASAEAAAAAFRFAAFCCAINFASKALHLMRN